MLPVRGIRGDDDDDDNDDDDAGENRGERSADSSETGVV